MVSLKNTVSDVYLTHEVIRMLRYIRRHKDCTEAEILKRFVKDGGGYVLINLCITDYLLAVRPDGSYTNFKDGKLVTSHDYRYWVTPKGQEFLDNRFDRMWQWMVPTVISVLALAVSVLDAVL